MVRTKIALITNTINRAGGAESVTITMFKALRSIINVNVYVLGREPLNKDLLNRWVDPQSINELEKSYITIRSRLKDLKELLNFDLIINTRSNEVLLPAHVHYIHWVFSPIGVKDPYALAYYRKAYNIEGISIKHIIRHVAHYINIKFSRAVLANSRYTADLLKEEGINAKVLYPPVRSREIIRYTSGIRYGDKDRLVITISRIDSGKQLELIPLIASKVRDARFVLVGSLANEEYYAKLLRLRKAFNAENFVIIPNIPRDQLYDLLGRAMIYLHTAHHEQFGIAVVEGMAAGCVPVVHRSGGPYHDIIAKDTYGFSYINYEETIAIIKDIIHERGKYRELSEEARLRSLSFDEAVFSLKFKKFIEQLID